MRKKTALLFLLGASVIFLFQNSPSDTAQATVSGHDRRSAEQAEGVDFKTCVYLTKDVAPLKPTFKHAELEKLKGPFESGQAVTKECLSCHAKQAQDFIETVHWNWKGPSPNMVGCISLII